MRRLAGILGLLLAITTLTPAAALTHPSANSGVKVSVSVSNAAALRQPHGPRLSFITGIEDTRKGSASWSMATNSDEGFTLRVSSQKMPESICRLHARHHAQRQTIQNPVADSLSLLSSMSNSSASPHSQPAEDQLITGNTPAAASVTVNYQAHSHNHGHDHGLLWQETCTPAIVATITPF